MMSLRAYLDPLIIDWRDRLADPVEEDDLTYSFFALLDDAELREVFADFLVPGLEPERAH